jgi:hypothetical protein
MHWNDDAVWNASTSPPPVISELQYPAGHPYAGQSIDLAFALTTPEPATLSLLALGGAILIHRRRKPKYKP